MVFIILLTFLESDFMLDTDKHVIYSVIRKCTIKESMFEMKKLDVNTVGIVWILMLFAIGLIVTAIYTFELFILLIVVFGSLAIFLSMPYVITYLWNRYVANK